MNKECNCSRSFATVSECQCKQPACFRKKQPDCLATAVIPAITVDSVSGILTLSNCLVHVTENNTTYYVDDKHRPLTVWSGDVEVDLPADVQTGEQWDEYIHSFNLKSQFLYIKFFSQEANKYMIESFYFDKTGRTYWSGEFEETGEQL